jgi:t-SNARE complex subunit (syntaxin)
MTMIIIKITAKITPQHILFFLAFHHSQVERLTYELRETMNEFRTSQADYVEKTRARFRRQMEIVKDSGEINFNSAN